MSKEVLIIVAIAALAAVNIGAFRYIGIWAFFVTAASIPFAERLLGMIEKL